MLMDAVERSVKPAQPSTLIVPVGARLQVRLNVSVECFSGYKSFAGGRAIYG